MASPNRDLPEGTDKTIRGAAAGAEDRPIIGAGHAADPAADQGGTRAKAKDLGRQAKDRVMRETETLRGQAGQKAREYASDGKARAAGALDELAEMAHEIGDTVDEKMGGDYGRYARQAGDSVADFSSRLRGKEVDELYDDARNFVRRSPAIAIGAAAAIGFALVRLVKAGFPDDERDEDLPAAGEAPGYATRPADADTPADNSPARPKV
ncbi:MAG: hypothetical protein ACFBQW_04800 [Sphingomonadaceae bacterium]